MSRFLPAGALVVAALLAFLPTLSNGWIWDDDDYILHNRTLVESGGLADIWLDPSKTPQYYPVVHTSFWIETRLWGQSPMGFHLVNILLHGLGAILLWKLLRKLGLRGAWVAGLLFAVHPVMTESVAWVTERKNVLSGVLVFAAALQWLRFQENKKWKTYAGASALFLGALLSKTVTASLPAVLLVLLWWKHGKLPRRPALSLTAWIPVGVSFGLYTARLEKDHVHASGHYWDFSFAERALVAGKACWLYLSKLVWPHDLAFFYHRWIPNTADALSWAWPLSLFLVLFLLWKYRARIGRGPLAGVLIFGGVLFPALSFFNVYPHKFSWIADHFQYHAAAAVFAMFGFALSHPKLPRWTPLIVALPLMGLSFQQSKIYENVETLWADTVQKTPTSSAALANHAAIQWRNGERQEALRMWAKAVELDPADLSSLSSLVQFGNPKNADAWIQKLEHYYPGSWDANYCRSFHALRKEDFTTAIAAGRRALLSPDRKDRSAKMGRTHLTIGAALTGQQAWSLAVVELKKATSLIPAVPAAHAFLGLALAGEGKTAAALNELLFALPPKGNELVAMTTLAWIRGCHANPKFRNAQEALRAAQTACKMSRNQDADALDALAAVYASQGDWSNAANAMRQALRLSPGNRGMRQRSNLYSAQKHFRSASGLP
ncbi:MAG: glycosyltransferase family 39 protein [Planctomycetota bacterium]|nr:glycosyltransferase family 39 protein [Planctomycetota bacterium]